MTSTEIEKKKSQYWKLGTSSTLMSELDLSLLHSFNTGNRSAFQLIYSQLYLSVFYFAKRFVNDEDAADITADAFYKLWIQEKNFTRIQSIKIFLQVIVRNTCINQLKEKKYKDSKQQELSQILASFEETENSQEETKVELLQKIHAEIENLPLQCRKIVKLAFVEGLKNKEIATILGISVNTVRGHKVAALRKLRIALLHLSSLIIYLAYLSIILLILHLPF